LGPIPGRRAHRENTGAEADLFEIPEQLREVQQGMKPLKDFAMKFVGFNQLEVIVIYIMGFIVI
jgi:hypothetical protein